MAYSKQYDDLRETIKIMMGYTEGDWYINPVVGEKALKELNKLQDKNISCPKIFTDEGELAFTWLYEDVKLFQYFSVDREGSHKTFCWRQKPQHEFYGSERTGCRECGAPKNHPWHAIGESNGN